MAKKGIIEYKEGKKGMAPHITKVNRTSNAYNNF